MLYGFTKECFVSESSFFCVLKGFSLRLYTGHVSSCLICCSVTLPMKVVHEVELKQK